MKKSMKRIISLALCLAMMAVVFVVPAYANDELFGEAGLLEIGLEDAPESIGEMDVSEAEESAETASSTADYGSLTTTITGSGEYAKKWDTAGRDLGTVTYNGIQLAKSWGFYNTWWVNEVSTGTRSFNAHLKSSGISSGGTEKWGTHTIAMVMSPEVPLKNNSATFMSVAYLHGVGIY
jgi:hypothetical protein